jgi:hypothetical protein
MAKRVTVNLGDLKAIQAVKVEHFPRGKANLGIQILVPAPEAGTGAHRAIIVAITITDEERLALIGALTPDESEPDGRKTAPENPTKTESGPLVGPNSAHTGGR